MYWKEIRSEAWARTKQGLGSGYRLTTSIALPIIGGIITCGILTAMTIPIPATLIVGVAVTISVYALLWFGEWCRHIIAIPPERDLSRLKTIEARDATIGAFQAPRPDPIRVELTYVEFAVKTPTTSVAHMNLTIRNSGAATTLEFPRLRSQLYGDIATCVNTSSLAEGAGIIEIGERKKKIGSASFQINSPIEQVRLTNNRWWVEFADIDGGTYKVEVPAVSYTDLRRWQSPNP